MAYVYHKVPMPFPVDRDEECLNVEGWSIVGTSGVGTLKEVIRKQWYGMCLGEEVG